MSAVAAVFKPRSAGEFLVHRVLEVELVDGVVRYVTGQVAAERVGQVMFLSFVDEQHDVCLVPCARTSAGGWHPAGLLQRASAALVDGRARPVPQGFELTPEMRAAIADAESTTEAP